MTSEPPDPDPKRPGASKAPTLADVARMAGVSQMAVSAALRGGRSSTRVSAQTRERVLAAAEQLRYRPNANALALVRRRTDAIGFITVLIEREPNCYMMEVFNGFIQGAKAARQTTAVFTLDSWDEAPTRLPALCDGRVDGLVVLAPRLEDDGGTWLPEHTPMVSVHASGSWRVGGVNVESDDEAGAHAMVREMLALGHRRILHVGGPASYPSFYRRAEGYLRAHAEAGLTPPPDHVVHTSLAPDSGREAMRAWLQRHRGSPLPDAVFGGSDALAIGCMEALTARGLRVPEDISIVGFDHTLLARTLHMAAVRQPLFEMGQQAVEALMQLIEAGRRGEPHAAPSNLVLPTGTVMDRTLAAPRRAPLLIS